MNQNATDHILAFHSKPIYFRLLWQLTCIYCISIVFLSSPCFAFDQSHRLFAKQLKKYVKGKGVLYSKWKEDRSDLDQYLNSLSELSATEYKEFSRLQKRALWLNAYNALAIKLVLDHYPIKGKLSYYPESSIRQIPDTWDAIKHHVAGQEVSLYTIAHDKLRKARDCRNHFAITPAARGGAVLQKEVFQATKVNRQLAKLTREFLQRKENLSCDPEKGIIYVSQIFRWFPLDFVIAKGPIPMPPPSDDDVVRDYVMQFLPAETKKQLQGKNVSIVYRPYDWSLNEAPEKN